MHYRVIVLAVVAVVGMQSAAGASGLLYRRNNQRWANVVSQGDAVVAGAFTGRTYSSFGTTARPAAANISGCATARIAAFSAKVSGAAPNTGLFIYDQINGTINDAVIQGAPTPITGFWDSFSGTNPSATIDPTSCTLHLLFRGHATGVSSAMDSGIFDATFGPLPALTPINVVALVQEGVTLAPAPFPPGALFADFPAGLSVPSLFTSGSLGFAFRGKVTGAGVAGTDDTGIFISDGTLTTRAREGDGTCPPVWTGSGSQYDEFPSNLQLGIGFTAGTFGVLYRAKSQGNLPGSDTALEMGLATSPCGTTTKAAVEAQATPAGGIYADLSPTTPLSFAANTTPKAAFLATITGAPGILRALFFTDLTTPAYIARQGMADTALGSGKVTLPTDTNPAINDSGQVVFKASVAGYSSGLFFYSNAVTPAQLLTFGGRAAGIDAAADVVARFP